MSSMVIFLEGTQHSGIWQGYLHSHLVSQVLAICRHSGSGEGLSQGHSIRVGYFNSGPCWLWTAAIFPYSYCSVSVSVENT